MDTERTRASWAEERRPTERERKKDTVGGERSNVLGVLQRRKCRLDSALTISRTGGTEVWNRRSGECPRPTWTWESSRRRSALMGSTPASWSDTASSLQTLRAETAAEWHSFKGRRHYSRWRPSGSTDPTSSASRSRRERGGGKSSDATSPPTTLRQ